MAYRLPLVTRCVYFNRPMVYSFLSFFGNLPTANAVAIVRCFSLPIGAILDVRNTVAWPHTELWVRGAVLSHTSLPWK